MKKQLAAFVVCGLVVATAGFGQAPVAVFHGDGPGINAAFLDDGSVDNLSDRLKLE